MKHIKLNIFLINCVFFPSNMRTLKIKLHVVYIFREYLDLLFRYI